jgi:hypothetical protein
MFPVRVQVWLQKWGQGRLEGSIAQRKFSADLFPARHMYPGGCGKADGGMDWMVWVDAILGLWEAMSCRLPSPAPMMMDCALAQRFFGGNPFVLSLGLSKQVVDCVVRGARCNHVIARSALEEADFCLYF